jgi:hypothetical protein
MHSLFPATAAAALLLGLQADSAAPPVALAPAGEWVVEYADDQCVAGRKFKLNSEELLLGLRAEPTDDDVWVTILAPSALEESQVYPAASAVAGVPIADKSLRSFPGTKERHKLYGLSLNPREFERLSGDGRLEVRSKPLSFVVQLTRLADIQKLLRDCTADLLASWGFSREAQAQVQTYPKPIRGLVVRADEYPRPALASGALWNLRVRVTVDKTGRPIACGPRRPERDNQLDAITCGAIMRQARFKPGRDHSDRPIESPYFMGVSLVMDRPGW